VALPIATTLTKRPTIGGIARAVTTTLAPGLRFLTEQAPRGRIRQVPAVV